jgi:iron complex outermembrane receptor protein
MLLRCMMVLPCLPAMGQQGNNPFDDAPRDTLALEDVTIAVLPFQETYQEATGGVFKLNSQEINRAYSLTPSEMINLAPGVYMASGSLNTQRVVIRGVGSRTPYNSNRIRAYLDDIPLTTGDGISTLEDLDLYSMGSLVILKGPSSALYGSGLGGVIRLSSPYPDQEGFTSSEIAEFGSFGTRKYGLTSTFKNGKWAIGGGLFRNSTMGYRENSKYIRNNAFLSARRYGNIHTLSLTLSMVDLYAEIPSSLNETDYRNAPDKAGGSWGLIKGYEEYLKWLGGIRLESELNQNLKNNITVFYTYSDPYERRPFNTLDDKTFNLGFREYIEYDLQNIQLRSGMEYFHEWYDWQIYETHSEDHGDLLTDQGETRRYLNAFLLGQWRPGNKILVDVGFNANLLNYSLFTHFRNDSTDQSGTYTYKPVISPRLGVSFRHSQYIWSYVTAGHGFSAPSLEETLLPEGSINNALKPESGWNLELGNRGSIWGERLQYDLTFYSIFLKDMLVTKRITEDVFTGINAGSARNSGMELWMRGSLDADPDPSGFNATLSLGYNISRNRFIDFVDDGTDYSGNTLPGIPFQEVNALLKARFAGVEFSIQHQYSGPQWMNDANEQLYSGHQLTHIQMKGSVRMASSPFQLILRGGIRNLFDVQHASMILINAPSFAGSSPRYYYPGTPRQIHLGIELSYK